MKLGVITKSQSHIEYTAQLSNPDYEIEQCITILGQFVKIINKNITHIAIVVDYILSNPKDIILSSTQEEFNIYTPDKINELNTYLSIITIGTLDSNNISCQQDINRHLITAGSPISIINDNELKTFHLNVNNSDQPQIKYIQSLIDYNPQYSRKILPLIHQQLSKHYTEDNLQILSLILNNIQWAN